MKGYGGGREREIIILIAGYTVATRMTSALRWAAMRANLMFHNCEGQSDKDGFRRPQLLKRKESRIGFEPEVLLLTSLTPYRWAKPAHTQISSAAPTKYLVYGTDHRGFS